MKASLKTGCATLFLSVALAVLVVLGQGNVVAKGQVSAGQPPDPLGAPFELIDHHGKTFTSESLRGRPFAIFFGFTQCPEVCPTTLNDLAGVMQELGPDANRITFLFVSVDPERDTPSILKSYISYFDNRIIGLSGNMVDIVSLTGKFGAFFERIPSQDAYTINHSTWMYLVGRDGKLADRIAYREDAASQLVKLRALAQR